ncbi:hypothetical protein [Staphylococcus hyicus]
MSKQEYQIQNHNINSYSDETSAASLISYEIEMQIFINKVK